MSPQRIQLSRKKGFSLQAASLALNGLPAVNCARPGTFGNPYKVSASQPAFDCVAKFIAFVQRRPSWVLDAKRALRGKNLACWCKLGSPCHADVLLEIANKEAK